MADDPQQHLTDPVVVVGRVGKPLGVSGEVYVFADPDLADPFEPGVVYGVGDRQRAVVASRMHGDRLVVAFQGVQGREGAEAVRGALVTRPREQVVLEEDTIWVADLIGRTVVDPDGGLVGVVETVTDGHAHDYLVIARPDGGEAMIPMVEELLDWEADPIVVQPMPGLLDPDEAL
ncbi:MAG TPA: ribosome maturation factor RimM [Euzebya sp.]|nr:ribosome maturation factor RimM [Euzebya sp.]